MVLIVGNDDTVSPARYVISFGFEYFVDELLSVDDPAFCSFQYGDLVSFQAAASAKKGFATIYCIFLESVNHDIWPF